MVFREQGITGGVFDPGVSEVFVQELPLGRPSPAADRILKASLKTWASKVRVRYREY